MSFSGVLQVSDLNDYLGPSQACIKPVAVKNSHTSADVRVDAATGKYYEVSKDGDTTMLETASISLNDCLACSGCITSAESILVAAQSQQDLYNVLAQNTASALAAASNESDSPSQGVKTVVVSISPQSRASFAAKYNLKPDAVHRRLSKFLIDLGVHHVVDSSFARDFSLLESAKEFVRRYRERSTVGSSSGVMPMLASACPGWICYAEKTYGYILPYISTVKSPQQVMGSLVKSYYATRIGVSPDMIFHISVMPCYDKKLEASRSDFYSDVYRTRDVDSVITTGELERMVKEQGLDIESLNEESTPSIFAKIGLSQRQGSIFFGSEGSSSGGYLSYIFRYAARELFGILLTPADVENGTNGVELRPGRNPDYREVILRLPGSQGQQGQEVLRFAAAYGFRNIQNLVRKVKPSSSDVGPIRTGRASTRANNANSSSEHHFIEVMACPSGCINGGGQLKPQMDTDVSAPAPKSFIASAESAYRSVGPIQFPEDNIERHSDWLGGFDTEKARLLLHTQYHAVEKLASTNGLSANW